jgi:hypothetical protein
VTRSTASVTCYAPALTCSPTGNANSERAAMICQHEARGADQAITDAIDAHVEDEKHRDDGAAGVLVPVG